MTKSTSTVPQARTRAAASPYRLPDAVAPVAYRLTIEPDLEKLTYNGVVEIDLAENSPDCGKDHSADRTNNSDSPPSSECF
jgi:hypothetical protein